MNELINELNRARKELLDLGMRNPLLNYPLKRGISIINGVSAEVYNVMVKDGEDISFLPSKESAETNLPQSGKPSQTRATRLKIDYSSLEELEKKLLKTYRQANAFIQEQGVNALFLVIGMLEWYESSSSNTSRFAPLILIPVELDRKNPKSQFLLRYTKEDIAENLSLHTKLKQEFGIELPPFPEDELDIIIYFKAVSEAISNQSRWSVHADKIALGFFSSASFLMYRDLDIETWPAGSQPTDHPIICSLLSAGFQEKASLYKENTHIDQYVTPENSYQVIDADSTQTLVLLDVNSGRNLVVQGPPGTGKSQTITNMIAEAIGRGKTVLFVAEKMAALEVVKLKLDSVGLGNACLELHSHKANKKSFLLELERTLELSQPKNATKIKSQQKQLADEQRRLNDYAEVVNKPIGNSGITPFDIYGQLLNQPMIDHPNTPKLQTQGMDEWDYNQLQEILSEISELQQLLQEIGNPAKHLMWGTRLTYIDPSQKRRIKEICSQAITTLDNMMEFANSFQKTIESPPIITLSHVDVIRDSIRRLLSAPNLRGIAVQEDRWHTNYESIATAITQWERHAQIRQKYHDQLIPKAWEYDIDQTQEDLKNYQKKWWRIFIGAYHQAKNNLKSLCVIDLPSKAEDRIAMADAILEDQRLQATLSSEKEMLQKLYGGQWDDKNSNWAQLKSIASWLNEFYGDIHEQKLSQNLTKSLVDSAEIATPRRFELTRNPEELDIAYVNYCNHIQSVMDALGMDESIRFGKDQKLIEKPLVEQRDTLQAWHDQVDILQEIISYNLKAKQLKDSGLPDIVTATTDWENAHEHLRTLIERTWYEHIHSKALQNNALLAEFNGTIHSKKISSFISLDKEQFTLNRFKLANKHWKQIPREDNKLSILKHEFRKKQKHKTIRKLMLEAGNAIQTIKPVFMMSPMSIAIYLPPNSVKFDLVIFDEASQVRPSDALGAIMRGKQVVVVGDSKQLPPTDFFRKLNSGDEYDEDEDDQASVSDMGSILDLFRAKGAPERMLRWHYRSRHDSLIAVSNYEFYDSKLVIFPSPEINRSQMGLRYNYLPDAIYESGTTRKNPIEAKYVAEAVIRHAKSTPDLTLGVVAFSQAQMEAILDQVEILRRQDSSNEAFFANDKHEVFFVKNLENVQGDERDVIFISIGYGKQKDGKITQNFGPLNRDGGERRLNVLITRARQRCEVFTNLKSGDIKSDRHGVMALKRYLKYADEGNLDLPVQTNREPDSLFEIAVANALRGHGYEIEHQIGSGGFFIDLVVVDPEQRGRYILAIECDGATYHSARSARDRDRLRQQVLEGLGWKFHRIWSTDWFQNPKGELEKTIEAIKAAQKNQLQISTNQ